MKLAKYFFILIVLILLSSCNGVSKNKNMQTSLSEASSNKQTNQTNVKKKYNEAWNINITGIRECNNDYEGFWRSYKKFQYDYDINYQYFEIFYNIKDNYFFNCFLMNGFEKNKNKYVWSLKFYFLVKREASFTEISENEASIIEAGLPKNYNLTYKPLLVKDNDSYLQLYINAIIDGSVCGYDLLIESIKIFPVKELKVSPDEIFVKQNPYSDYNTLIRVDPLEGLWYIPTAQGEANEADFVNTKAILIIGKDEDLNPGWYHVVIYYDLGDPERGWICEWGAAEIAEREIEVQLSPISEGKPYTITLKEENGRRWIETTNQAATVKGKQFIRILPLK